MSKFKVSFSNLNFSMTGRYFNFNLLAPQYSINDLEKHTIDYVPAVRL